MSAASGIPPACNVHPAPMPDPASYVTDGLAAVTAAGLLPRWLVWVGVDRVGRLLRPALETAAPVIAELHDRARADALAGAVWCSDCGAGNGERCASPDGRPHATRRARAVRRGLIAEDDR